MRILLIEDEQTVAGLLADAVAAEGHETIVAYTGPEGLAYLGRCPDVVFLDVRLPEMSGIEVLRRIRATHPELPVVRGTGNAEESELEEARRLGVAGIVEKPSILKKVGEVLTRLT